MKRNFLVLTALMIGLTITSCKSSSNVSDESSSQYEKREQQSKRSEGGKKGERKTADQLITEMDGNSDGKLSKSEVKGPLKNDFSSIDTNNDGFISKQELENAPKPQRGNRR